jgi:mono/diheme cytochrome c family protein
MMFRAAALALLTATPGIAAPGGTAPGGAAPGGAALGPFTAAQAAAGQTQYNQACAACHGADLRGRTGPALIGDAFAAKSDGYTLAIVFNNVWEGTPAGAPDSLSRSGYVNIMAYLMARNGVAPGTAPLTFAGAAASTAPFYTLVK